MRGVGEGAASAVEAVVVCQRWSEPWGWCEPGQEVQRACSSGVVWWVWWSVVW